MASLHVAIAQISPIFLNRTKTLEKICSYIEDAARAGSKLIVFGEAHLPGYPFWLDLTGGAVFNDDKQKTIHAHYIDQAVSIEAGHLDDVCALAKKHQIAIYLGIIERPADRAGHSLYCSLVYITQEGVIASVHRKLQPTYEERLAWSPGDGNGLRTHPLEGFTVGGLNCWENWMPLVRASLYAQGENVHIAVWPGSKRNTEDLTRVIAKESRSYVISASCIMHNTTFTDDLPHSNEMRANAPEELTDGGSCIANPDGSWLLEPQTNGEGLFFASLELEEIRKERQNFDPSGHYSRPDVTQLHVDRRRQSTVKFHDGTPSDG